MFFDKPAAMNGLGEVILFYVEPILSRSTVVQSSPGLDDEARNLAHPVGKIEVFEHGISSEGIVEASLF